MEATVPSRMRTSARRSKICEGSRSVPLVMRSEGIVVRSLRESFYTEGTEDTESTEKNGVRAKRA